MKHYTKSNIENLDNLYRLNLMNSCSGYKSANLLATLSGDGITNVAVFNSVTHIGSNPPLLSFILRPTTVSRNTYKNIKDSGVFTVNSINKNIFKMAHQTAAKYEDSISEFSETGLEEEYLDGFFAPYVKQSSLKMGCSFKNEYHIKENDTIMLIAEIQHLYFEEKIQMADGWLKLDEAETVAIIGLDGYALPMLIDRLHYPRPGLPTRSLLNVENKI